MMKWETKNMVFETDGEEPEKPLPEWSIGAMSELPQDGGEGLAHHLTMHSGWLIRSFDYRYGKGKWKHYEDDLKWRDLI